MSCATHDKLQLQVQLQNATAKMQLQLPHRMQRTFNTQPRKILPIPISVEFPKYLGSMGSRFKDSDRRFPKAKQTANINTKQLTWLI